MRVPAGGRAAAWRWPSSSTSGVLRRAVYPLLIASQTVPVVVLAPILVILLGYNIRPKLVIIALICFFPIVVNGVDGLRSVDPSSSG